MRLTKFAIDLLNEVAEECDERSISFAEPENKRRALEKTSDSIVELMEILAES